MDLHNELNAFFSTSYAFPSKVLVLKDKLPKLLPDKDLDRQFQPFHLSSKILAQWSCGGLRSGLQPGTPSLRRQSTRPKIENAFSRTKVTNDSQNGPGANAAGSPSMLLKYWPLCE